ncbi:MAG: hypothetical protein ABUL77_02055 [Bacteroidota bacterium]
MSGGGRSRTPLPGVLLLLGAAMVAVGDGCVAEVAPSAPAVDRQLRLPVLAGFDRVADAMQPSCGTLDCHGQVTRNLRLFGERGLRLDAQDTSGEGATTLAEYEADYWAIVTLEPEILSAVLRDGGRGPERLMLVRKGRGATRHKGGALMRPNGPLDQCVLDWLKGNILEDQCKTASRISADMTP